MLKPAVTSRSGMASNFRQRTTLVSASKPDLEHPTPQHTPDRERTTSASMSFQCPCGAKFGGMAQLMKHVAQAGHLLSCGCGRLFRDEKSLDDHVRDTGHLQDADTSTDTAVPPAATEKPASSNASPDAHICLVCNTKLFSAQILERHMRRKHRNWPCPTCDQCYPSPEQRIGHQQATGHCYCAEHDIVFDSKATFASHNRNIHITAFECVDCERTLESQIALDDHLKSDGHAAVVKAAAERAKKEKDAAVAEESKLRCEECDRDFKNIKAFRQHKDSVKHKPLSELSCPMSNGCKGVFNSPSALLFHLESGKCKSGMNRLKLNALVHMHDTSRHVTYAANAASVISTSSSAGTLPGPSDLISGMSSLSISSCRSGVALTPSASDQTTVRGSTGSVSGSIEEIDDESTIGVTIDIGTSKLASAFVRISDDGSDSGESDLTEIASSNNFSTSTIRTPSVSIEEIADDDDSASVSSDRTTTTTTAGVPIFTPTASRCGSTSTNGGVNVDEWTLIQQSLNRTQAPTSTITESAATITYDSTSKNWPCSLPSCRRTFPKKKHLLQHMGSPAHTPELFHCPRGLEAFSDKRGLGREKAFKTLSGFAQHIEAGACVGGKDAMQFIAGLFESEISRATGKQVKLLKGEEA